MTFAALTSRCTRPVAWTAASARQIWIAIWQDRATLQEYLDSGAVPRGTELMRKVGVEPELRVVDVLELG